MVEFDTEKYTFTFSPDIFGVIDNFHNLHIFWLMFEFGSGAVALVGVVAQQRRYSLFEWIESFVTSAWLRF